MSGSPWAAPAAIAGLATGLGLVWMALLLLGAVAREVFGGKGDRTENSLFDCYFVGLTTLVVSVAVFRTGGRTLMTAVLPLLALVAQRPRLPDFKKVLDVARSGLRDIPWIVILFLGPVFIVNRGQGAWPVGLPHQDDVFYGRLASSLFETGCENVRPYLSLLQPAACGIATYHYAEEWLGGAVAVMLGGSPSHLMLFVIGPVLIAGAWLGIRELLPSTVLSEGWRKALAAGMVLLPAPRFSFLASLHPFEEIGAYGGMSFFDLRAGAAKQAIVVLALVAVLRAVEQNKQRLAGLVLLGLIPFSASAAPAALCWALYIAVSGPAHERSRLWAAGLSVMVTLAAVVALFGERGSAMHSAGSILSLAGSAAGLQTRVNVLGKTAIQLLVAFSPWWLALGLAARTSVMAGLVLRGVAVASAGGVLGYAAVLQLPDSPQFATRFPALSLGLAGAVLVVRGLVRHGGLGKAAAAALLLFGGVGHVLADRAQTLDARAQDYRWQQSPGYLEAARRFVPTTEVGAFLVSPSEVPATWDSSRPMPTFTPHVYQVGTFLGTFPQYRAVSLLSPPDQRLDPRRYALAQFAPEWSNGEGVEDGSARIIKKYCVSYLVASRNSAIPKGVALDEVARDEKTGERLFAIRNLAPGCRVFSPPQATFWRTLFVASP